MQVITEDKLEAALEYLASSDESSANLKADVARSKYVAELAEAFAFKTLTVGTVTDKQAEVQMDKGVQAAWDKHFTAIAAYEKVRARRERAVLIVDIYRTQAANRRVGNV